MAISETHITEEIVFWPIIYNFVALAVAGSELSDVTTGEAHEPIRMYAMKYIL